MKKQKSIFRQRLKRWFHGELAERPLAEQLPYLASWFKQPCGQILLQQEKQILDQELSQFFGYHLLNMSVSPRHTLTEKSPIHHQFSLSPIAGNEAGSVCAEFSALPIENDSVDVALLHHTLEFSHNPHQVLKEVSRVLVHRGHVVIVAFNTFSLLGVWKRIASLLTSNQQWRHSSLNLNRLNDWFKLLDLEKTKVDYTFYRPPFSHHSLLARFSFLESIGAALRLPLGGVHIIIAQKNVCGITPIKTPWPKVASKRMVNLPNIQPAPKNFKVTNINQDKKVVH